MNAIQVTAPSALVTGSSRGIGRGIAVKLAECGVARIGIHYLKNKDDAEQTARLVEQRGAHPTLIQADVTQPEEISRMFAEAREALGPWAYSLPTPDRMCSTFTDRCSTW